MDVGNRTYPKEIIDELNGLVAIHGLTGLGAFQHFLDGDATKRIALMSRIHKAFLNHREMWKYGVRIGRLELT